MKLAILSLILILIPNVYRVNGQEQSDIPENTKAKIESLKKLEAQLKEIDELGGSVKVKVKVKGDKESSLAINIKVDQGQVLVSTPGEMRTSKLFNINLNELDIPDEYIKQKIDEAFSTQSSCGMLPAVKVSQLGVGVDYQVVEDYIYNSPHFRITVFKGFIYDRASIPRVFWVLIDKDSLGNVAPLLHDLLYRHGGVLPTNLISPYRKFSRKDTDKLFLELMTKCGVGRFRRVAAYEAVRKFSGFAWKGQ